MLLTKQKMTCFLESRYKRIFAVEEFDVAAKRRLYLGDIPDMEKYLQAKDKAVANLSRWSYPPCMTPCFMEPILSVAQEQHQFRKYNLLKHMSKQKFDAGQLRYAYCLMERAVEVGNQIAQSNFRLAASETVNICGLFNEDSFSEAYMGVMKSVDYFDWRRGIKFSTYATWSIRRTIYTSWQRRSRKNKALFVDTDKLSEEYEARPSGYEEELRHEANKHTVARLLEHCGPPRCTQEELKRRQFILRHRFGLGDAEIYTLQKLGDTFGISKERVRQLEITSIEYIERYIAEGKWKKVA